MTGRQNRQDQVEDQLLQYALEWQMKTRRVSEYSQYLRSMASRDARYLVQSTASNNDARLGSGDPVRGGRRKDAVMTDQDF
jgi:hypothetical protein